LLVASAVDEHRRTQDGVSRMDDLVKKHGRFVEFLFFVFTDARASVTDAYAE
jgi:hypothetical protein